MPPKNTLKSLIESIVSDVLKEQEEDTQKIDFGDDDTSTPSDADSPADTSDSSSDTDKGLDLDFGGDDSSPDSGSDEGGELDLDSEDNDLSASSGGAGGGLNIGSGGGFSGGGGDLGGDEDMDFGNANNDSEAEEDPFKDGLQPGEILVPEDPIKTIVDQAVKMLDKTNNNQIIYNNIKASIQDYFKSPEDAAPIIQSLWKTEDLVLRAVARKLLLFIKGI